MGPNIINFDAVDFSERRSEEVISFLDQCKLYLFHQIPFRFASQK